VSTADYSAAIDDSIRYLKSEAALRSSVADTYWPKWHSPWWHITLLHEMGLAEQIPQTAVAQLVQQLQARPLTIFPIHFKDVPPGVDASCSHCHCALGNIYQALAAAGVDVDGQLPWIRQWFLRYQLPDGGMNCDELAYVQQPPPSSMVGAIAPLEAVLLHTKRTFTPEELEFLERGAQCLLERHLNRATANPHNAEEKTSALLWPQLCFPRFYLYDILRGLNFVLQWSALRNQPIARACIDEVVRDLSSRADDGQMRIGRQSYAGICTRLQTESGDWQHRQPATLFPLLQQVSRIGAVSPFLTAKWQEAQALIGALEQRGLLF